MKNLFIIILVSKSLACLAQSDFSSVLIDGNANSPVSVYSSDIDLDGDLDVIAALYDKNAIEWWENRENGSVWERHFVDGNFGQAGCVVAGDIDGDGRPDIVASARSGNQVAWWKNTEGDPVTWTKQTIRVDYYYAHEVKVYDLDQDGDLDVLGASSDLNQINWWRNDGGSQISWTEFLIDNNARMAKSFDVADINNDGFPDLVGAALFTNEVILYLNKAQSQPAWDRMIVDANFLGVHRVEFADIDGDGVLDILGAGYTGGQIAWWRNSGANPITWRKQTIAGGFTNACIASAGDLNRDGRMDVVATSQGLGRVSYWIQSTPEPGMIEWEYHLIDHLPKAWALYLCDLDQDNDIDVISASGKGGGNNDLKWYPNNHTSSVFTNTIHQNPFTVFPNPGSGNFFVEFSEPLTESGSLEVFNASGTKVFSVCLQAGASGLNMNIHPSTGTVLFVRSLLKGQVSHQKIMLIR